MFRHSRVAVTRLWALSVLSVLLMVFDQQQGHLKYLRSALSVAVMPLQYLTYFPSDFYHSLASQLKSREALLTEAQQLQEENLALKQRLQYLVALEAENNSLKMLTQSSTPAQSHKIAIVEVLQTNNSPYSQRFIINKGSLDGVYEGQAVLDAFGILGQVIQVGPKTSEVLVLTDPSHAIPVQAIRSGARAIAAGDAQTGKLTLKHVTLTADFQVGDLLVSSGLGQRFPKGYPVGIIESIDRKQAGTFVTVLVKPSAHVDVARELLLIWPTDQEKDTAAAMAAQSLTGQEGS